MRRKSREENRARTRERLLISARDAFGKNGYSGTSIDLIAENGGFSKGAFYSNFESKESIFVAVLQQHKEAEIQALHNLFAPGGTPQEIIGRMAAFYSQLQDEVDWGLLSAEFQMQAARDVRIARHARALNRTQRASLGQVIAALFEQSGRKIPAKPEELAAIFIALSTGLALQRASDKSGIAKGVFGDAVLLLADSLLRSAEVL